MIDVEAESRAHRERSLQLTEQLSASIPVVDKGPIREALAESKRLGDEAFKARDRVVERVRKGKDPGVTLGPVAPIRKVPAGRREREAYDVLKGRAVVSAELVNFWAFQRDQVGPAIVRCYEAAAERLPQARALLAAAQGHQAALRQRGAFDQEGGVELEAARRRLDECRGQLMEGVNDGRMVTNRAVEVLEQLQGEATAAKIQGQGVDFLSPWIAGRVASLLGHDFVDAKQPLGPQAKEPAPHPVVARAHPVATRSTASWRADVEPIVRSSLPSAAEPVIERFYGDAGVRVKGSSRLELR
jgi:hypothetical protein